MTQRAPLASLAIINYNGADYLPELCATLAAQTSLGECEIFLIDNASQDKSLALMSARFPEIRLIRSEKNLGFARAGNLAFREAAGRYVALLNTDLKFDPTWLEHLLTAISKDPEIGAVAPKMRLYDRPEILNGVGGAMNRLGFTWDIGMLEPDRGQCDVPREVIFAPAAASLFDRSLFLEAGGFDDRFFMYHEDVDFGWRLWLFGKRIVTCPDAIVYHHFGGSTRASQGMLWREVLGERNNIRSLIKNYEKGNLGKALFRMVKLGYRWPRKLAQFRNFLWNLLVLPETLEKRRDIQNRRVRADCELDDLIVQSDHVPIQL